MWASTLQTVNKQPDGGYTITVSYTNGTDTHVLTHDVPSDADSQWLPRVCASQCDYYANLDSVAAALKPSVGKTVAEPL